MEPALVSECSSFPAMGKPEFIRKDYKPACCPSGAGLDDNLAFHLAGKITNKKKIPGS
jgi:hypothetical protein